MNSLSWQLETAENVCSHARGIWDALEVDLCPKRLPVETSFPPLTWKL